MWKEDTQIEYSTINLEITSKITQNGLGTNCAIAIVAGIGKFQKQCSLAPCQWHGSGEFQKHCSSTPCQLHKIPDELFSNDTHKRY